MKKLIPFGDRILVKRRKIGDKIGGGGVIIAPDEVKERPTEIADVVHVPDNSFADNELIGNADEIVKNLTAKARQGDSQAFKALIEFNFYMKAKTIQPGDAIFITRYVGTDIMIKETGETLTLVDYDGIIGKVIEK